MKERIGCIAWIVGTLQFFWTHAIVETAWPRPYSWARNNISDLGNVYCTVQAQPEPRYVCSPAHDVMNLSFVLLGTLLGVGAAFSGFLWRGNRTATVARTLLVGAGIGFGMVGLAPADVYESRHVLGALLVMGTGNLGLLLAGAGLSREVAAGLRWSAGLLGALALTALCLFLSHRYLGFGKEAWSGWRHCPFSCGPSRPEPWDCSTGLVPVRRRWSRTCRGWPGESDVAGPRVRPFAGARTGARTAPPTSHRDPS